MVLNSQMGDISETFPPERLLEKRKERSLPQSFVRRKSDRQTKEIDHKIYHVSQQSEISIISLTILNTNKYMTFELRKA